MSKKQSQIEDAREFIDVLALIDILSRHALGREKMTATQVSAALALLKKVVPDITSAALKAAKDEDNILTHEEALKEIS